MPKGIVSPTTRLLMTFLTAMTFPLANTGVKYGDADCRTDYLLIPGGSEDGGNSVFARDR